MINQDGQGKWVILTKVPNDIEFEMVAGILRMADIPAVKSTKGIDGYIQNILGVTIAGVDVLVPEDRLEEALELLNAEMEEETDDSPENEQEKN